ncbi:MAG: glycosyltransferase WbuB [Anaerolineae bacterium]|nr:MAG: glycosyltransferase WbuB [Anaerolineae bacterium]
MKITILTQEYAPEEISSAVLSQELAEDLATQGHQVTVVTRAPNYPQGKVFPGYRNSLFQSEFVNHVRVIRVWSYITPHKEFWHRILSFGTYSLFAIFGALLAGKPDILMAYSPPLPLGVSGWLVSWFFRIPWILRVEDLYPEAAVAAGVLKNQHVIRFFDRMAHFLYQRATHISLITDGFRRILLRKGVPEQKMSVTPVWADPDFVRPQPKHNRFRERHGFDGKAIVMYAGVLGLTSSLEDVIEAAKLLEEAKHIQFVIVGEGVKKQWIQEFIQANGVKNVTLLPFQPRAEFPEMMAAADLNLVTLNQALAEFALPHKIFNIMASERAILAIAPPQSDLATLITQHACGVVVPPNHPQTLANTISTLITQPEVLKTMGGNGRNVLLKHFSRSLCTKTFDDLFQRVARSSSN